MDFSKSSIPIFGAFQSRPLRGKVFTSYIDLHSTTVVGRIGLAVDFRRSPVHDGNLFARLSSINV